MSASITKDLKYYLQNPDEMPTDPKELEALANEQIRVAVGESEQELTIDRFTSEPEKKDEKDSAPSDAEAAAKAAEEAKAAEVAEAAKVAEEAKAKEEAAAKAAAEAEAAKATKETDKATANPEGVLAKDGKNVIPYAVLTSARERAEVAERLAQTQAQEIERLKAEKAGTQTAQAEETAALSDEELEALAEDSPTLAKILKAQQQTIAQLNERVKNVVDQSEQQETDARTEAEKAVQEAIDANPVLAAWQVDKEDQGHWNEAARIDRALRESPLWRSKSFDERFEKVVELTKAVFGEVVEPPKPDVKDVKVEKKPAPTEAEIRAAAEAKLAEKSKAALPVSLSQIPGGTAPATDERERVEQMSVHEIGSKLLGMTKEQQEAYLASL